MNVTNIAPRLCPDVGEGPHYDGATDELLLVNIPNLHLRDDAVGCLYRKKLSDSTANFEIHETGQNFITFATPTKSGTIVIGADHSIVELDWPKGGKATTQSVLTTVEEEKPTRFNDGKCDSQGRLLAGTMCLEEKQDNVGSVGFRAKEAAALYGINTDRSVRQLVDKVTVSNGLAWTKDDKTFLYIDSLTQSVFAYDYDSTNFAISNRRVLFDLQQHSDLEGAYPDGCCIDADDRLWVACYNGSCVICIDTNTGQRVNKIPIPAKRVTSCIFAGPSLDQMIVTTCKARPEPDDPDAGSLYRVTNLGVKGTPMMRFEG